MMKADGAENSDGTAKYSEYVSTYSMYIVMSIVTQVIAVTDRPPHRT
jgi:hypothetical protein